MTTNTKTRQEFKSELLTLNEIAERGNFNVPIYQRLYVWNEKNVQKLLDDLKDHKNHGEDKPYFLGSVVVVKSNAAYDLIDGQQRFTTLWLILRELKDSNFANSDRLTFSIREYANQYFKTSANQSDKDVGDNKQRELVQIREAEKTINKFFFNEDFSSWRNFLSEFVKINFTEVPSNTDLNKLFEAFNSGGVQLQQHELLKAQLLKHLVDKDERAIYEKIWTACSLMDTYVEDAIVHVKKGGLKRNLWDSLNNPTKDTKDDVQNFVVSNFVDIDWVKTFVAEVSTQNIKSIQTGSDDKSKKLRSILSGEDTHTDLDNQIEDNIKTNETSDKCRSIISFPLLLLHSLRIYLNHNDKGDISKLDDKKLLELFKEHLLKSEPLEDQIKEFIETLWKTRVLFDRWIIKWVSDEDDSMRQNSDEYHAIKSVKSVSNTTSNSATYLIRSDELKEQWIKALSILQSMLYHTQEQRTHYWLTPILNYLMDTTSESIKITANMVFLYLQGLDNHVLSSEHKHKEQTLLTRTWNYMRPVGVCENQSSSNFEKFIRDLNDKDVGNYHRFSQYDLNKIDFILWFNAHIQPDDLEWNISGVIPDERYNSYEFLFRRRNSIEHVAPQNMDPTVVRSQVSNPEGKLLHGLGNLVLLSSSDNSSQSDKPMSQKMAWIEGQTEWYNHPKLSHINRVWGANNKCWDEAAYQKHLTYVYKQIEQYSIENN